MDLIQLPFWSETQMLEYFTAAAKDALSHGLTSITDAGLNPFVIKFLEQLVFNFDYRRFYTHLTLQTHYAHGASSKSR